jgi:hypothetical protein
MQWLRVDRRKTFKLNVHVVFLTVILQPMKEDPPLDARCKDKFLVQSAIIPVEQEVKPLAELVSCALLADTSSSLHPLMTISPSVVRNGENGEIVDIRAKDQMRVLDGRWYQWKWDASVAGWRSDDR